jgi:protein-arginine kinase
MVNFYSNAEKEATTALIKNSSADAQRLILKRLGLTENMKYVDLLDLDEGIDDLSQLDLFNHLGVSFEDAIELKKALMPKTISATVRCHNGDTYDEKTGRDMANEKVISNFNKSLKKAVARWQRAMLNKIRSVDPETFNSVLEEFKK